jgi:protein gp37
MGVVAMSDRTRIEWCDATWNPVRGCSPVSDGCRKCYAERMAARFVSGPYRTLTDAYGDHYLCTAGPFANVINRNGKWNGRVELIEKALAIPLHWRKPRRIFVNSMSDLFHERIPFEHIKRVWDITVKANWHTYLILTKREKRMLEFARWMAGSDDISVAEWPRNVWLGVSVEDQATADARIPHLLQTPAPLRFVSVEPMLGPVDLSKYMVPHVAWQSAGGPRECAHGYAAGVPCRQCTTGLDWVICGGETGPGARPMHPAWVRSLRDQCVAAGVPFLFKQWGEWSTQDPALQGKPRPRHEYLADIGEGAPCVFRVGKRRAGRLLDGRTWDEFPADVTR